MFVSSLTDRGATPALEAMLSYTQQRHQVIAENIANVDTPGYQARHMNPVAFQRAVGQALKERGGDPRRPLQIRSQPDFEIRDDGSIRATPQTSPMGNVMFHDGTTMSIEQEMADLASNAMMHQAATTLLKGQFERLMSAIRGRI